MDTAASSNPVDFETILTGNSRARLSHRLYQTLR